MTKRFNKRFYNNFLSYLPESGKKIKIFRKKIYIYKNIRYYWAKKFLKSVGKNVNFQSRTKLNYDVSIGNNSGVGKNCDIPGGVTIGNNVMMGEEVLIFTSNHITTNTEIPMNLQGMTKKKKVIICDDVWIGTRVTILPGVTVGKGSILGTGTVVTKDVPEYSVVVGNPGRVVKNRKE